MFKIFKNIAFWNIIFQDTFLRIFIPQRKPGEKFTIKNTQYITEEYTSPDGHLSCISCIFCNCCGNIPIWKRGMCTGYNRKDKRMVKFKINKIIEKEK